MTLFLFGISGGEIFVVLLIFLLLFGADKIPEMARALGKGMFELKKATDTIKQEINQTTTEISSQVIDEVEVIRDTIETPEIDELQSPPHNITAQHPTKENIHGDGI